MWEIHAFQICKNNVDKKQVSKNYIHAACASSLTTQNCLFTACPFFHYLDAWEHCTICTPLLVCHCCSEKNTVNQGGGVTGSRRIWGGVGVEFLRTPRDGVGVGFFYPTPTLEVQLNQFLLSHSNLWLLKWYNFFWNFCGNSDILLCTTISIDC